MKNIIILFALIPLFAAAQTPDFKISGKIGKLNQSAMVYLDYMDNAAGGREDSAKLVNGEFSFSGNISGIANARMSLAHSGEGKQAAIFKGGDVIFFYFGKEQMTIISDDSLLNAKITGSEVYDAFTAYNKVIGGTMMDLTKAANIDFAKGTPEQQKDTTYEKAVGARFHQKIAERTEKQMQFAKDHPNSFFGLVALSESAGSRVDPSKIEPIFNAFSQDLRSTDVGLELAGRIKAAHTTSIGDSAPLFTQNDINGKPFSLASLKGKIVLVDFWASWCHPCRGENPNLVKQYQLYKDKGFEIVSVSLDSDKKNWQNAISQDGLTWLQVSDLKGWNNAVGRLYGIRAVPSCFLIDADGKIIANDLRGETLNQKLAQLFKN